MSADVECLHAELPRLDALLFNELERMRARYQLSMDELRGRLITHERVDALLRPAASTPATRPVPPIDGIRLRDVDSRWAQLARVLPLTGDERDLLLLCLAPEIDEKYETLFAYLNDDVTRRWMTTDLAIRVLARDLSHAQALRGLLLPGGRLSSSGVVEYAQRGSELARGKRPLRAAPPLADWLRGLAYVDERLTRVARFGAFERRVPDDGLPARLRPTVAAIAKAIAEGEALAPTVVTASAAHEALLLAEDAVARAGRLALVVDALALKGCASLDDAVSAIQLAQHLLGVTLVVGPLDALTEGDGRAAESVAQVVRRLVSESPRFIAAAGRGTRVRELLGDAPAVLIDAEDMTPRERAVVWHTVAGDDVSPRDVDALADRFALGADRIARAAATARAQAALHGRERVAAAELFAAARQISFDGDAGVTRLVSTHFDWKDLIVPAPVRDRLTEFVRAIELRSRVLDAWGFARTVGNARGIKAMFAGPSGTGKTMAAAIVARTLQVPMARLELGSVVSKYLGETEKNLDRAFAAARQANAILFIDEADALLGKRAQVKDAHDRYANVEVAYLLQKMEDHDGVVIVATNLAQNIDEAFSRRMQFVVEFPVPDIVSRERLWRAMLPADAPVAADVDVAFLARQFELAGGDIRNIVLDAAYRAAHDEGEITLGHLLRALAQQYAKRGRVPTAADFREHFALLAHG